MYSPIQKGIEKSIESVEYIEVDPPSNLSKIVHRFWEIKTKTKLTNDFNFHILPDACVHIVFNLADFKTAGVTTLRTSAEVLNLGKEFHFVGIRFFPGVWRGNPADFVDGVIDNPYLGKLPLIQIAKELDKLNFSNKQIVLSQLVQHLINDNLVTIDALTSKLLENIDNINSVADMATIVSMSTRQLQRKLKKMTGYSPHDFLKVLRLQQSFLHHYLDFYAGQSHFIHSFRKITGYTPEKYVNKFDV